MLAITEKRLVARNLAGSSVHTGTAAWPISHGTKSCVAVRPSCMRSPPRSTELGQLSAAVVLAARFISVQITNTLFVRPDNPD